MSTAIDRQIVGDHLVDRDTILGGMVVGDVRVPKPHRLVLGGTVTKSVIVEEGAEARIYALVGADVINEGGLVQVYGYVLGEVIARSGRTEIAHRSLAHDGVVGEVSQIEGVGESGIWGVNRPA